MKPIACTKCGSNDLIEEGGFFVCAYCRMKFIPSEVGTTKLGAVLSVYADIQDLLEKCKRDPVNRRRLANLILDLDPTNADAKHYLK